MNTIISPPKNVHAPKFPYTIVDVAIVYRHVRNRTPMGSRCLFLAMVTIIQEGIYVAQKEGTVDDFVERARIQQAESWPVEHGSVGDWEYVAASTVFHVMHGVSR